MSSSRDFGFTTLRSVQAYQPNGARVPPNNILTTAENGAAIFTDNLYISSINASTISSTTVIHRLTVKASTNDTASGASPPGYMSEFIRLASSGTVTTDYQVAGNGAEFGGPNNTWQDARYVYNNGISPGEFQVWSITTSSISTSAIAPNIGDIRFYNDVYLNSNKTLHTSLIKYASTAAYPNPNGGLIEFDVGGPEVIYMNSGTTNNNLNLMGGVTISGDKTSGGDLYLNASTSAGGLTYNNIFMNNPTTIEINQSTTRSGLTLYNSNSSSLNQPDSASGIAFSMGTQAGTYTWFNTFSTSGVGDGLIKDHLQLYSYFPGPSSILDIAPTGNVNITNSLTVPYISTNVMILVDGNASTLEVTNIGSTMYVDGQPIITDGTISTVSTVFWNEVSGALYNKNAGIGTTKYQVGVGTNGAALNATLDVLYTGTGAGNVFNLKNATGNLLTVNNNGSTLINGQLSTGDIFATGNISASGYLSTNTIQMNNGNIYNVSSIINSAGPPLNLIDTVIKVTNGSITIASDNYYLSTNLIYMGGVSSNINFSSIFNINSSAAATNNGIINMGTAYNPQINFGSAGSSKTHTLNGNFSTSANVTVASILTCSTLSTNTINMTTGQINGLSTINNIAWPPIDDALWSTSGIDISNDNTGNVGIGTASPQYKLDVTGNIKTSGYILSLGNSLYNNVITVTGNITLSALISNPLITGNVRVNILAIGGGGGGDYGGGTSGGGGGGSGQEVYGSYYLPVNTILAITIGTGGATGVDGTATSVINSTNKVYMYASGGCCELSLGGGVGSNGWYGGGGGSSAGAGGQSLVVPQGFQPRTGNAAAGATGGNGDGPNGVGQGGLGSATGGGGGGSSSLGTGGAGGASAIGFGAGGGGGNIPSLPGGSGSGGAVSIQIFAL
jgi:hypothetical protein